VCPAFPCWCGSAGKAAQLCELSPRKGKYLTDKTNHSAQRRSITKTRRNADHAPPIATQPVTETTDAPSETAETRPADADRIPHHRQGTPARRPQPGARRLQRRTTGGLGTVPTAEQWAQEQLKNAPLRSHAWARAVAAIYGLDVQEE
jgi:hypothetical protein